MDITLNAGDFPLEGPNGMISDRMIAQLRIRPVRSRPTHDQAVPAFIFDSLHCARHYRVLAEAND
eukprot:8117418-Pyramimonas_sp.AAC.1